MAIGKFISRPVEVEAIQLSPDSFQECLLFIGPEHIGEDTNENDCFIQYINEMDEELKLGPGIWFLKKQVCDERAMGTILMVYADEVFKKGFRKLEEDNNGNS